MFICLLCGVVGMNEMIEFTQKLLAYNGWGVPHDSKQELESLVNRVGFKLPENGMNEGNAKVVTPKAPREPVELNSDDKPVSKKEIEKAKLVSLFKGGEQENEETNK